MPFDILLNLETFPWRRCLTCCNFQIFFLAYIYLLSGHACDPYHVFLQMLKMFCEDCCELLCPICALMKHRQCSKLNSVTPMAADRRLQLETSQRNLISTLGKAKEKQAKLKEEKEVLSRNITCSLREMDEAYDSLITRVKEQKKADMLRSHEAITKAQKHLANCEEQIGVLITVLEENVSRTQSRQLLLRMCSFSRRSASRS